MLLDISKPGISQSKSKALFKQPLTCNISFTFDDVIKIIFSKTHMIERESLFDSTIESIYPFKLCPI